MRKEPQLMQDAVQRYAAAGETIDRLAREAGVPSYLEAKTLEDQQRLCAFVVSSFVRQNPLFVTPTNGIEYSWFMVFAEAVKYNVGHYQKCDVILGADQRPRTLMYTLTADEKGKPIDAIVTYHDNCYDLKRSVTFGEKTFLSIAHKKVPILPTYEQTLEALRSYDERESRKSWPASLRMLRYIFRGLTF